MRNFWFITIQTDIRNETDKLNDRENWNLTLNSVANNEFKVWIGVVGVERVIAKLGH